MLVPEEIPSPYRQQVELFLQQPDGEEIAKKYLNVVTGSKYWTRPEVKSVKSVNSATEKTEKNMRLAKRKMLAIALCQEPKLTVVEIAYKTGLSRWEVKKYLSELTKYHHDTNN